MKQFTKEQAIAFNKSEAWKKMSHEEIVKLQLYQRRLCVPFNVFHEAIEKVLKRPVWTHEFMSQKRLQEEYEGKRPKPSFSDIMNLIPEEKRIILFMGE